MSSLVERLRKLIVAEAHHSIDRMESPIVMSQAVLRDLVNEIQAVRRALVASVAAERQLQDSREKLTADAEAWSDRAEAALRDGSGDAEARARDALTRALLQQRSARGVQARLPAIQARARRLRGHLRRLQDELFRLRGQLTLIEAAELSAATLGAARGEDAYVRAMQRLHDLDACERRTSTADFAAEAAEQLLAEEEHQRLGADAAVLASEVDHALEQLRVRLRDASQACADPTHPEAASTVGDGASAAAAPEVSPAPDAGAAPSTSLEN